MRQRSQTGRKTFQAALRSSTRARTQAGVFLTPGLPSTGNQGARLPLVSTRDVVGHGRFTILTGIGGKPIWQAAADEVSKSTGVEIVVASIGWGQDYADTFFRWHEVRGVGEKGAVLVRPDRTVAWRAQAPLEDGAATSAKLQLVVNKILGLDQKEIVSR